MPFHVVVTGSLTLKHAQVEEWLSAPVLVDHLEWLTDDEALPTTLSTPEHLVAHLQAMTLAPHEILDVALESDTLKVSAYLSDENYEEGWAALSRLFASAGGFDGTGTLTVLGFQGIQLGERISLSKASVTHRVLTLRERDSAQREAALVALTHRIQSRFDALVGRPAESHSAGVNPFTGR